MEGVEEDSPQRSPEEENQYEESPQMYGNSPITSSSPAVMPEAPYNASPEYVNSGSGGSQERITRSKLLYEADPEDAELRKKLLEAKMARKKTEDDAKVLMNRLLLLKNEEQKAWKRIEETKKKAEEIIKMRQRNEEMIRKKEERERQKEEAMRKKQEMSASIKQQTKSRLEMSKMRKQGLIQAKANAVRIEKTDTVEFLEQQKQENLLKKFGKKQEIQEREREALERKRRENEERKEKAKAALEEKILTEQRQRLERESLLARMEQEEEELIEKLKNTQMLQQAALEDLEQALSSQSTSKVLSSKGGSAKKSTKKK